MQHRLLQEIVTQRLASFPAVALVGPRQVGKTTLARLLSPAYFDLEQAADRLRLDLQWNELVAKDELIILDEAQTWPEIFPRLRGAIDARRRTNGRFLLLGSVSPVLMRDVAESLAGRLALCALSPFLLAELGPTRQDDLWLYGGYPDGGILAPAQFPVWAKNYLELLATRDLPAWGLPAKAADVQRLFRMLAAVHGQTWNASQIGKSLGLSYHTANTYADFLAGAFLIRWLPPFHANVKKRLVKSPKVYWRDSGLLHALLGVATMDELLAQPWVGASFEGWVIEQLLATLDARGIEHEAFFFRTSDGIECDLLLRLARKLWVIEVKLTTNPTPDDLRRLEKVASLVKADRVMLISRTAAPEASAGRISTDLIGALSALTTST
jgi:predicted AAA+ superfamily ATPase